MNRLYLVRHGENLANLTHEFSCRRVDHSLTPKGVLQARQAATFFTDKSIHEIYASPLKRAAETAAIIAGPLGLSVTLLEPLLEIDVGTLEGRPATAEAWALYRRIFEDWFAGKADTAFPGGENHIAAWDRLRAALQEILAGKHGRNIVLVGHGGLFTATLKDLCPGIDREWLRGRPNHNGSITEILARARNGTLEARLIDWASITHLHGEAAEVVPGVPEP